MRESITLHVGQCGNQIGKEFWDKISLEHGINENGELLDPKINDRKETFFYETDENKFIPRSILIDLEPRVVQGIVTPLFNPENIFLDSSGGGAGNNWAHGYTKGKGYQNDVFDIIQREVESCDNLESFMLFHSIAGGTGSGFGSVLLENLRENYPKKMIQAYSIFPNNEEISDVVVQPYNSMLTLQRLALFCDSVVVMDNTALTKINSNFSTKNKGNNDQEALFKNYSNINSLISTAISASTSTLRFPTYMLSDLRSLNSILIPIERLKFIIPSYTPFTLNNRINRKTDCQDIMRKLLLPTSRLAAMETSHSDSIISMVSILNGVKNSDLQKSLIYAFERENLNFVKWMPPSFHVVKSGMEASKSGLALTNGTNVTNLLTKVCDQFDKLKKKNAFIEMYKKFSADLSEFDECREVIQNVIEAYQNV